MRFVHVSPTQSRENGMAPGGPDLDRTWLYKHFSVIHYHTQLQYCKSKCGAAKHTEKRRYSYVRMLLTNVTLSQ